MRLGRIVTSDPGSFSGPGSAEVFDNILSLILLVWLTVVRTLYWCGEADAESESDEGAIMRIEAKPRSRYSWWIRPFFWNQKRKYGAVLDAALLWGRVPRLFAGVAVLYGTIDRRSSPIDPALRSLVTVLVSQINSCSFCVDLNSATLLRRGVSKKKSRP